MSRDDETAESAVLARVLAQTPRGAATLAGLALGLLLIAWLAIYLFVFLARGPVS